MRNTKKLANQIFKEKKLAFHFQNIQNFAKSVVAMKRF